MPLLVDVVLDQAKFAVQEASLELGHLGPGLVAGLLPQLLQIPTHGLQKFFVRLIGLFHFVKLVLKDGLAVQISLPEEGLLHKLGSPIQVREEVEIMLPVVRRAGEAVAVRFVVLFLDILVWL